MSDFVTRLAWCASHYALPTLGVSRSGVHRARKHQIEIGNQMSTESSTRPQTGHSHVVQFAITIDCNSRQTLRGSTGPVSTPAELHVNVLCESEDEGLSPWQPVVVSAFLKGGPIKIPASFGRGGEQSSQSAGPDPMLAAMKAFQSFVRYLWS